MKEFELLMLMFAYMGVLVHVFFKVVILIRVRFLFNMFATARSAHRRTKLLQTYAWFPLSRWRIVQMLCVLGERDCRITKAHSLLFERFINTYGAMTCYEAASVYQAHTDWDIVEMMTLDAFLEYATIPMQKALFETENTS